MKKNSNNAALKWILATIKDCRKIVITLIVFAGVLATSGTVTALLAKSVIDTAVSGKTSKFVLMVGVLAAIYIIQTLLNCLCMYMETKARAKIEMSIQHRVFDTILGKKYNQVCTYHSGELLNRLTADVTVIGDAAASIVPNIASMLIRLLCATIAMLVLQPLLVAVFLTLGTAVFFVTKFLRVKIKRLHVRVQETDEKTRSFWQECVANLLAVKVFSAEEKMSEKAGELQGENFKAKMRKGKVSVTASAGYGLLIKLGYIFAFGWCGYMLLNGSISYGTLIAMIQLIGQVQQPFAGMSGIIPKYYAAIGSAERLIELEKLDDEKKTVATLDSSKFYEKLVGIRVSNMSFSYGRDVVFDNMTTTIKKGEFLAVTGSSGIGKSTLFKLLLGVYQPREGSISFVCEDGVSACDATTRSMFAYVPQGNLLFSGSIRENISFVAPDADEEKLKEAIRISCAEDFVKSLPEGLDTIIGERGMGLSEGQVQRLAIARAVLTGAPILLLDEATSALDSDTEARVLHNIREMRNKTCVIVTHRKQALSVCDKELLIKSTRV